MLANPLAAVLLGLLLGCALIVAGRLASRFLTPEDGYLGLARVALAMVLRMGVALLALLAYRLYAPAGLVPFGIALPAGFLAAAVLDLFVAMRAPSPREVASWRT